MGDETYHNGLLCGLNQRLILPFLETERGLKQGCPLSPLLFLLVAEGINKALLEAKRHGSFTGIAISNTLKITQLLFVDDIIIFYDGTIQDAEKLAEILDLFGKSTKMVVNSQKSSLTVINMEEAETQRYSSLFPFGLKLLDEGLKYLVFMVKPNHYKKEDWNG